MSCVSNEKISTKKDKEMSLSQELDSIKQKVRHLLSIYPELRTAHANERLITFWKYYDGFGDRTLYAEAITNYHSIDRAFRYLIPDAYKNYKVEKEYRKHYGKP